MKKIIVLLMAGGLMAYAAKKPPVDNQPHYSVCIVSGSEEICSKPLVKDVADNVAYVLSRAPILGLDLVYEFDTLKPQDKPKLPAGHPPVNQPGSNTI